MKKVFIATSRPIGERCRAWAAEHMPDGFVLSERMSDCDIFISVLYDKILPLEYLTGLDVAVNFHPGILPEYRGSATYSWAIVNGEREAGVTFHIIEPGIDTGAVISIERFPIFEHDTAETVFNKAEQIIFKMFVANWAAILNNQLPAKPQDESHARTYHRRDLQKLKDITPIVRALTFNGKEPAFFKNAHGERVEIDYYAETT